MESEAKSDEMMSVISNIINPGNPRFPHNCCGPWPSHPDLDMEGEEGALGVDCAQVRVCTVLEGRLAHSRCLSVLPDASGGRTVRQEAVC